ncbi:hypothetical protein D3C76_1854900 [compost metagenome]
MTAVEQTGGDRQLLVAHHREVQGRHVLIQRIFGGETMDMQVGFIARIKFVSQLETADAR